ncbi:MAG: biopolymer transporter ExbD [Candidatus Eisenbacteria bacterium]|nr:biopolymer transporter ExbD [Candidatus Eisenbacteria bacterium]
MPGRFKKKAKMDAQVPTSSMADLAFLLLVFFMVTTIFRLEDGLPIELPKAAAAQQIPREKLVHIWVNQRRQVSINDNLVPVAGIQTIILSKLQQNPALIVAFNADKRAPYDLMSDIMEELKQVNATKVSFTADYERLR